jgi:DNA-binding transcriptional MocR family regulator
MSREPSPVVVWRRTILKAEGLSSSARLVALVLMDHMNGDGGSCFPSLTTLSRESGRARSTVCIALDELERGGYISRRRGRGIPTRYLATSPTTGLPLVRSPDSTSPIVEPEGVQEDAHNLYARAPRARKKTGRAAAHPKSDPFKTLNLEGYDRA